MKRARFLEGDAMKHKVTFSLCAAWVFLMPACQPDTACHRGRVMANAACVFPSQAADAGGSMDGGGGTKAPDAGAEDAAQGDAETGADAASDAAASTPGDAGSGDSGALTDAGFDAGMPPPPPIPEAPYCMSRTALPDEDKYGKACTPADPSACGSLTCQTGANYCTKSCTVGDACSCPGGFACVSFGGPATACVPTWGRTCSSDVSCRAQAPLCVEGPNFCTSVCDPQNAKTCPDTWSCASTPGGNFCIEPSRS